MFCCLGYWILSLETAQNLGCIMFLQCIKVHLVLVFEQLEILPTECLLSVRVLYLDPGTVKGVKFMLFPVRSLCFTGSVDK